MIQNTIQRFTIGTLRGPCSVSRSARPTSKLVWPSSLSFSRHVGPVRYVERDGKRLTSRVGNGKYQDLE